MRTEYFVVCFPENKTYMGESEYSQGYFSCEEHTDIHLAQRIQDPDNDFTVKCLKSRGVHFSLHKVEMTMTVSKAAEFEGVPMSSMIQ